MINGEFITEITDSIEVGQDTVITVYSYLSKTEKKIDGLDIFFLKVMNRSWNTTINMKTLGKLITLTIDTIAIVESEYVSDEVYTITYSPTVEIGEIFELYSTVPLSISATYYPNYQMVAPVYLNRILKSFPASFTDDTNSEYSSSKYEALFIAPTAGTYKFSIMISKNSQIDFKLTGKTVLKIENSLFFTQGTSTTPLPPLHPTITT